MHIKISVWTSLKISLLHHHALHTSAGWSNRNAIHQLAAGCRPPLSSSPKYCRSASASRSAEPTWGPGHPDGQTWNPEQGLRDLFFFLVFIHALLELTCFTPNWVETVWHALGEWCFQSSVRGNIFPGDIVSALLMYLHCFSLFRSQADHYSYSVGRAIHWSIIIAKSEVRQARIVVRMDLSSELPYFLALSFST
jgi:hypothetical protein